VPELTTYLIPNLIQGVSQQADAQRDPTQAEEQINAVSSLGEGLRKRDPTVALARVSTSSFGDAFVHTILRDGNERYLAVIRSSGISVFALDGSPRTVNAPGGYGYLASVTDATAQIRATSIADVTFISNRLVAPAMDAALAPAVARPNTHEALAWVKAANYGQTYRVNLNGTLATVTTQVAPVIVSGGTTTTYQISTADIAEQVRVALAGVAGVTITRVGSVLHFTSASAITLQATDARANADITAITNSVQSFTQLPTIAPQGYQVEVVGDPGNRFDGYYVNFQVRTGGGTFGEGSWEETVAPGVEYKINPATMPHVLVRLASGQFYFGPANGTTYSGYELPKWGERTAGDYESAPDPTFIGKPINDIFVYRNRLGLLADEAVVLSRAQDFFEFFPETTIATLDSDPIDLSASNNQVSILRYAVTYQDELILFSEQLQFRLGSSEQALTPATAQITVLTQYEIDPDVRPIQVAGAIVFAQKNGQWTQFREFSIRGAGTALVADAQSLNENTGSYVPGDVFRLAVNATGNAWYAISQKAGYANRIYTHKFFFRNSGAGGERVQASWSYWQLTGASRILQISVIEEVLYLLVEYPGGAVFLERMRVADREVDDDSPEFPLLLDRRVSTTTATPVALRVAPGIYNTTTQATTWTLPYAASAPVQAWSAYGSAGAWEEGARIATAASGDTTITASGNWSSASVFFGEVYDFLYTFTRFKAMREIGGGKVAMNEVRTQVRSAKLRYHDSGYFEATVTPEGRAEAVYRFTAPGPSGEGVFSIPIMSEGRRAKVTLRNPTARPCKFTTCEWVGLLAGKVK
jgi:ribulose bisphosphate carboxylase small subunit